MGSSVGRRYSFRDTSGEISAYLGELTKILYILNPELDDMVNYFCETLKKTRDNDATVYLCAEGRSGHTINAFSDRLRNFGFNTYPTKKHKEELQIKLRDELENEVINGHSVGIIASGSGETDRSLDNARFLRERGVEVFVFTSYTDSDMSLLAESEKHLFIIPGGIRKGEKWSVETYNLNADEIVKNYGYPVEEVEHILGMLSRLDEIFYLGGGFETSAVCFEEMLNRDLGRYLNVSQEDAASRHPRDDIKQ